MAHPSISQPDPDSAEPVPSPAIPSAEIPPRYSGEPGAVLEFSELRNKFSSLNGGNLSAELSADLALKIFLNQIIEEARVAAGASGASIILPRDGEWVCRASSGSNAPALGARTHGDSGVIAACIREGQVQCCDDCEIDSRVDVEACRALGVRSVIAIPLVGHQELLGVLTAFSALAFAFGKQQQVTLESFGRAAISGILQAAELPEVATAEAKKGTVLSAPEEASEENSEDTSSQSSAEALTQAVGGGANKKVSAASSPSIRLATWILAALIFALAGFLIAMAGQRLLGKDRFRASSTRPISSQKVVAPTIAGVAKSGAGSVGTAAATAPADGTGAGVRSPAGIVSIAQEGSLTVYENGREVFHIPAENEPPPSSVIYKVEPEYPEQARAGRMQGKVVLEVQTNTDGSVKQVQLISGPPMLADPAIAAVKQWRFRPHLEKGQPVGTQTRISLDFKLPSGNVTR